MGIRVKFPSTIDIFEVGPRDGLQNESKVLSLSAKLRFIEKLISSGIKNIEVGAFVRDDRVPQMTLSDQLFKKLNSRFPRQKFWALVPNEKGLDRALKSGCHAIGVFTGATNSFTKTNIGLTIDESLREFEAVIRRAHIHGIKVRGYVSVCWGCPYEGRVSQSKVLRVARALLNLGVVQVALGDTIGVATPVEVMGLLSKFKKDVKGGFIAGHFHDTRGTALANCLAAIIMGVRTLDSSSGGLGGCNFAPGAAGNIATEDLVYMLDGMGITTGVDIDKLCEASFFVQKALGKTLTSKYLQATLSRR